VGRINLTYALTVAGTIRTELTIVRQAEDAYYLVTAGAAEAYDSDYLAKMVEENLERFGAMYLANVTSQYGVFALAGPKAREVLKGLVVAPDPAAELTNKAFPWLSARQIDLGMVPTLAIRVAYTGELGWELHHPMEMQNHLFDRLMEAGAPHGLKLVGARAQNWLRQEKSYRAFGSDLGRDATPLEIGLDRFVDLDKDYKGKQAMLDTGIRAKCVTVLIDGPDDADPWGREGLFHNGEMVGRLTSGGYSVAFGKQIGIGYVRPDLAVEGTKLELRMFRALYPAVVTCDSPYDPKNETIWANG
jgi:dimethylglycine dehydrogenase